MPLAVQFEAALLLLLATILCAIIGLDRERRDSPAGLRTHMLVGIGACLFTLLSTRAFPDSESARVAAQVVSGIGFIGAGTILQVKRGVHHLTTAASIWATAAVGMTVGVGAWFLAVCATLMIWIILRILRMFQDKASVPPKK